MWPCAWGLKASGSGLNACSRGNPGSLEWQMNGQEEAELEPKQAVCPDNEQSAGKRAETEIREGTRKLQVDTEGILMHIDRTDQVVMASKPAVSADPGSSFGLVFVLASGTPATGASFGAGRARDANLSGCMGEIVDFFALCFVAQVAHALLGPATQLVFRPLHLLPTARVLLAPALLSSELSELSASLPLEGADVVPGDDQGRARAGGHGGKAGSPRGQQLLGRGQEFASPGSLRSEPCQLEAPVPHQGARPDVFEQSKRQHQGRVAFAHRQHYAPLLLVEGLGGPLDRVERFGAPGVRACQLGMLPAQLARGLGRAEEDAEEGRRKRGSSLSGDEGVLERHEETASS